MNFDLEKILQMAPFLAGALRGPSPEGNAMLEGFMKGQQGVRARSEQDRERQRQEAMDLLQQQNVQLQQQNVSRDNARADESQRMGRENHELNRLRTFRSDATARGDELASGMGDPLDTQNQLTTELLTMAQQYGVPPGSASTVMPNMTAKVSEAKKRRAKILFEDAKKKFDPNPDDPQTGWEDAVTLQTAEFGPKTPSALRAMFEAPSSGGVPYVKPLKDDTRSPINRVNELTEQIAAATDPAARAALTAKRARLLGDVKETNQADDRPLVLREPRDRYQVTPVTNPDGTTGLVRVNIGTGETMRIQMPDGAAAGKPTEGMRLSADFLGRTTAADKTATSFESKLAALGPQLDVQLPNLLKSEAGQLYKNAQDEFINAGLRDESGAAIQPSEYDRYRSIYFMVPGDSAKVLAQKQGARQRVRDGQRIQSGNLAPKAEPAAAPGPAVGTVRSANGETRRWTGKSWEPVK